MSSSRCFSNRSRSFSSTSIVSSCTLHSWRTVLASASNACVALASAVATTLFACAASLSEAVAVLRCSRSLSLSRRSTSIAEPTLSLSAAMEGGTSAAVDEERAAVIAATVARVTPARLASSITRRCSVSCFIGTLRLSESSGSGAVIMVAGVLLSARASERRCLTVGSRVVRSNSQRASTALCCCFVIPALRTAASKRASVPACCFLSFSSLTKSVGIPSLTCLRVARTTSGPPPYRFVSNAHVAGFTAT
mmetsp:Transcript_80812/g.160576  ORF Transcript_80812/g.160576 Transcript_80812/m.160576 type:complete len:251 (+) Transcript_80812:421-1173(+)